MTQNNNTPVNSSNGPEQIDLLDLVGDAANLLI